MRGEADEPLVEPGAPEPKSEAAAAPPFRTQRALWWHGLVVLALLVAIVALVLAAIAAVSPGPPQITMVVFPQPPRTCNPTTNGYPYTVDAELSNDGGPAWVTLRAYMDGVPAPINGVNATITTYVSGPEGAGDASFTIYAPDCNPHAVYVDIARVVPA